MSTEGEVTDIVSGPSEIEEEEFIFLQDEEYINEEREEDYTYEDNAYEMEEEEDIQTESLLTKAITEEASVQKVASILKEKAEVIVDENIREQFMGVLGEKLATDIVSEITRVDNENELGTFIYESLEKLTGRPMETPSTTHGDTYFWMSYFYLQFCGYQFYLHHIATNMIFPDTVSHTELAMIIVELVDEVAENADYLKPDSSVPELLAKNLMWKILNSRKFQRRYFDACPSEIVAGDILDDLIDQMMIPVHMGEEEERKEEEESESMYQASSEKVGMVSPEDTCRSFSGLYAVCEYFVDDLLEQAVRVANTMTKESTFILEADQREFYLPIKEQELREPFPTIKSFNTHIGEDAIRGYLETWKYEEEWKYCIDFLMAQSDACSDFYFYEVKWSIPTMRYPVAQATASVYFRLEVSRVKPGFCPINITYRFEGTSLEREPYQYPFKEQWLFDIVESKLCLFSQLDF